MKKNLLAVAAIAALATSSAFAQGVDTLAKIKSAGVINFGVRESSGLGYTLGAGKFVGFHTEMGERIIEDLKKQKLHLKDQLYAIILKATDKA